MKNSEFLPYAPENDEEQVYVIHQSCPAVIGGGPDHKARLAIRRTNNGRTIMAYCHHCGEYRVINDTHFLSNQTQNQFTDSVPEPTKPTSNDRSTRGTSKVPDDSTGDIRDWPSYVRAWVFQYGITIQEIMDYGIRWSNKDCSLLLPVTSRSFCRRKFKGSAKYISNVVGKDVFIINHTINRSVVCITEDIVSAIKVGRHASSVALLGASLPDHILIECARYDTIYLFLDDDNRDIKIKQIKIKEKLSLVCRNVIVVRVNKDPKECTDEELRKILNV